jgi:hypothetical protein
MEATRQLCALLLNARGYVVNVNQRPGETLRWKVEAAGWEGWGVVCEKSAPPRL